jgi:hypothetical protein
MGVRAVSRRADLVRLVLLVPLAGAACDGGASSDSGLKAWLRLSGTGTQFFPGELDTTGGSDKPTIEAISISNNIVFPGVSGRSLGGSAIGSSAILIGLEGDVGHWGVPTGTPDGDNPKALDFSTSLSISPLIPLMPASRAIVFRAVDARQTVGPPMLLPVKIQPLATSGQPLVISLLWDTDSDLDLKVRVPDPADPTMPIDVWNKSSVALPVLENGDPPYTTDDVKNAGKLDYDSNAQCVLDGLRRENVIFPQTPPSGTYQVRVDSFSLCGQVAARWHAFAMANGTDLLGEAYGQAGDVDTQGSHGPATGILAFSFTVP